ncbi:PLP-dependent transferase [Tothia fuscella]|uniref:PLP-dependent transferase n=1 Tax=Tothia fuscella TaxID=1048955 RepID=A0A9P4TVN9_9PEZI|nr:PLP-dependent transferase [Tothia fuscella]
MQRRIGAVLWPKLQCLQIYGANTDVGKTIVSTLLCSALSGRKDLKTHYLKPVSTGPLDEADNSHIARFVPNIHSKTLFQFSQPLSPHLALAHDNATLPDSQIQQSVHAEFSAYAQAGPGIALVETAGGVLSPAPSGTSQADLYRPFRLPVLLVGDYRLGGIGTSISAFESLYLRGYDINGVVLLEDDVYKNVDYLREYFEKKKTPTFGIQPPPPRDTTSIEKDAKAMQEYYNDTGSSRPIQDVLETLTTAHENRIEKLHAMPQQAHDAIWYPFTQHQGRTKEDIMVIDSAYNDDFAAVPKAASPSPSRPPKTESNAPLLQPSTDASASWWTQGLGHGNPTLALTAANAAGRYGHVMFASAINEPSLNLAQLLLTHHKNPRLAKVYYTDNGSTGMEVGIKMALRAACVRYGWDHRDGGKSGNREDMGIEVLGLRGSYHGDTMGVMDASEPSVYNDRVEWYKPRGYWFHFPQVKLQRGQWIIDAPPEIASACGLDTAQTFSSLNEIFDLQKRDNSKYIEYITATLTDLVQKQGRRFGALVMEPVILGAGGMLFADPLFQHTLVTLIRSQPTLISPTASTPPTPSTPNSPTQDQTQTAWSGLPILYDEVFTGLYRLGCFNCSSFLQSHPDIIVNAKLLTGGLVPLCTTTASQSIFDAFLSENGDKGKGDALLHGHSYTAHAVGCSVAVESLGGLVGMEGGGAWDGFKGSWARGSAAGTSRSDASSESGLETNLPVWSCWSQDFVKEISHKSSVSHVIALGSVLAIALKDEAGSGYNSNASISLREKLLETKEGWNIHSRVLGNVIYFMAGQRTTREYLWGVEGRIGGCID